MDADVNKLTNKEWLDKAEIYANSKGLYHFSFKDEYFWLEYKNRCNLTPEEAVEDYLNRSFNLK